MKQSELSGQLSGAESTLAGPGPLREIRHAIDQHVINALMWDIFTVSVQTIHPHVFVVMSVIFSFIFPGSVNGTKKR